MGNVSGGRHQTSPGFGAGAVKMTMAMNHDVGNLHRKIINSARSCHFPKLPSTSLVTSLPKAIASAFIPYGQRFEWNKCARDEHPHPLRTNYQQERRRWAECNGINKCTTSKIAKTTTRQPHRVYLKHYLSMLSTYIDRLEDGR